jgi:hypothetical protein
LGTRVLLLLLVVVVVVVVREILISLQYGVQ